MISIANIVLYITEQLCKIVWHLYSTTDYLIGQKITWSKRNSLLQSINCASGNPVFEVAVCQGHVRNRVDLVHLACEDGNHRI